MKKFLSKPGLFLLPGIVAYVFNKYAQNNTALAEEYSRSVYPMVSNAVGFLPSLVKFSVSEWLVVMVLLFSYYTLFIMCVRLS